MHPYFRILGFDVPAYGLMVALAFSTLIAS
jgi:hypothetical protein